MARIMHVNRQVISEFNINVSVHSCALKCFILIRVTVDIVVPSVAVPNWSVIPEPLMDCSN